MRHTTTIQRYTLLAELSKHSVEAVFVCVGPFIPVYLPTYLPHSCSTLVQTPHTREDCPVSPIFETQIITRSNPHSVRRYKTRSQDSKSDNWMSDDTDCVVWGMDYTWRSYQARETLSKLGRAVVWQPPDPPVLQGCRLRYQTYTTEYRWRNGTTYSFNCRHSYHASKHLMPSLTSCLTRKDACTTLPTLNIHARCELLSSINLMQPNKSVFFADEDQTKNTHPMSSHGHYSVSGKGCQ